MPGPPVTPSAHSDQYVHRRFPDFFIDAFPLALLLAAMVSFDRWFSFLDLEGLALSGAARPVNEILAGYLSGGVVHSRPPLYELLLHFWLLSTSGAAEWLRVPPLAFYVLGIWLLSRSARLVGGLESGTALVWLGVLWPYGFHFGRVESWYSFAFFLIAGATWAYLRHCSSPSRAWWITACVFALALVYTCYLGWALLALLAFDFWFRNRQTPGATQRLAITAALLVVAYAPLWPSLFRELAVVSPPHQSWKLLALNTAYNTYVLMVSPAMAPWFWRFGVPAAVAVAAALLLVLFGLRGDMRRLLIFSGLLLAGMSVAGLLATDRLFLPAPWCLIPVAVALGTIKARYWRGALVIALVVAGGIGWYGTYQRRFYASSRFLEPWGTVAAEAGAGARRGAIIIANKPALFLYMTYALRVPESRNGWRFQGILPDQVRAPGIWDAPGWQAAGMPISAGIMWIRGTPASAAAAKSMDDVGMWLDRNCGTRTVRYLVPNAAYDWEQRLYPQLGADTWAVQIREYECGASSSGPPPGGATPEGSAGSP